MEVEQQQPGHERKGPEDDEQDAHEHGQDDDGDTRPSQRENPERYVSTMPSTNVTARGLMIGSVRDR